MNFSTRSILRNLSVWSFLQLIHKIMCYGDRKEDHPMSWCHDHNISYKKLAYCLLFRPFCSTLHNTSYCHWCHNPEILTTIFIVLSETEWWQRDLSRHHLCKTAINLLSPSIATSNNFSVGLYYPKIFFWARRAEAIWSSDLIKLSIILMP